MELIVTDPEGIYRTSYALASMTRINIVKMVSLRPMSVTEISEALRLTKGNVSNQIASLEEAGLLQASFENGVKGVRKLLKNRYEKIVLVLTE
nr:ArsR family transcriptional regulator [Sulfodiicoccus acidiphilus]